MSQRKELKRSRSNRMIAGVCGGLADYLGMDPTLVRLLYIGISVISVGFPGLIVYVILALVIPEEDQSP